MTRRKRRFAASGFALAGAAAYGLMLGLLVAAIPCRGAAAAQNDGGNAVMQPVLADASAGTSATRADAARDSVGGAATLPALTAQSEGTRAAKSKGVIPAAARVDLAQSGVRAAAAGTEWARDAGGTQIGAAVESSEQAEATTETQNSASSAAAAESGGQGAATSPQGKAEGAVPQPAPRNVTAYTLPPELYRKAVTLGRIDFYSNLLEFAYMLALLWLVLHWKIAPRFRDWAERVSANRVAQAAVFAPPLVLTLLVLRLPMDGFNHAVLRTYAISVEGWGAWAWDWTKAAAILVAIGIVLTWILYAVIRRSPRRWWFWFWVVSLPLTVFMMFVEPLVLEPMFFQFAPLSQKDPALVAQLERVVHRAGLEIPASRMFWMKASTKTPTMNAYVSGIGASKRIVVWDTDLTKETTAEIVSDFGHEMGHYVLGHIWKGMLFSAAVSFVLLWLGFVSVRWVLARWGAGWSIRGIDDWASLPALLLVLLIFNFLSNPISSAFSRHIEHQADIYGLEVTHGLLANANQAAADALQVEGEAGLADPRPNPLDIFLFYGHPPISGRIQFCLHYDPWRAGHQPRYVK